MRLYAGEPNDSGDRSRMLASSGGASHAVDGAREVAIARQAQPAWAATPLRERLYVIRRTRHAIASRASELATAAVGLRRSTAADALVAEVLPLADSCRFLEREAEGLLAPRRPSARSRPLWLRGVSIEVRREPLGVILLLGPSNYPLLLPSVQALQALAAGNAVILKPGRGGLPAAVAMAQVFEAAGLDVRLFRVLPEAPDGAHAAIATGVDKVLLTGSAETGAAVLAELAPHLTPATLELSGCDAAFVREDADLELAARALAFSLRLNAGATCIAPRRVFVARAVMPALEARLVALLGEVSPHDVEPASTASLPVLVAEALQQGARLLSGRLLPDRVLAPIVLTDASPAMRLLQEDVFAPLLSLVGVCDDDEALSAAARCPYALGVTIFGAEVSALALAGRVHAGVVVANDVIVPTADPRLPFGGRGRSGFGVTRGAEGLLELTAVKAIAVRRGTWRPHLDGSDPGDGALFQAYIAAAHGGSLTRRADACWRLLRALAAGVPRRSLRERQP
jgi:acyl-CoA reductase-like NAD-dependent aldehyde dehydrogenase